MWTRSCSVSRFGLWGALPPKLSRCDSPHLSPRVWLCASWSAGTSRRRHACALIDRSSCLVEPVLVLSRARAVRTEHVQHRVRSLLANISIARPCGRSCALEMLVPRASLLSLSTRGRFRNSLAQGAHHHTLYPCSCSPSRHLVRHVLSLSQRCGSDVILASSSCLAVYVVGSGSTGSCSRPEPRPSRCRWRSQPELLLSLRCDYSSHPFVLGAVSSTPTVSCTLSSCHLLVFGSWSFRASLPRRPCRDWSHWHAGCCAATAVPHLVRPPGTDSRSRCRSLASVSHPVSTPRPLRRRAGFGLLLLPLCSRRTVDASSL